MAISAQKGGILNIKNPQKGVFWILDQKTKTSLFYIYGAKASWKKIEKSDARFQRYSLKQPFLPKKGVFWIQKPPERGYFEFLTKKRKRHFFYIYWA